MKELVTFTLTADELTVLSQVACIGAVVCSGAAVTPLTSEGMVALASAAKLLGERPNAMEIYNRVVERLVSREIAEAIGKDFSDYSPSS